MLLTKHIHLHQRDITIFLYVYMISINYVLSINKLRKNGQINLKKLIIHNFEYLETITTDQVLIFATKKMK